MVITSFEREDQIYEKLQLELENLPGEDAHVELFPGRGRSSEALKNASGYRRSAVLALLYLENGVLHGILTERQSYKGNHSGQMSFPGGKMEQRDQTAEETALRETEEEIGVDRKGVQILGSLTDVYIPVSNFLVHPYVGFVSQRPKTIKEEREVKTIVHFPISDLMNESNKIITTIDAANGMRLKNIHAFNIQEKIVWGATALICNELRHILNRF